ncbi:MAG: hypothetical protein Q7K40_04580 [bacterium]|nr:hypothetical protein [bacterium]
MFTTKNLFAIFGKHVIIAFGFLLIASGIVFYLSGQITKITATVSKNQNLATSQIKQTEIVTRMNDEIATIGDNDTIIRHSFIPSNNILEFISTLESLALRNGLIQSFNFPAQVTEGESDTFSILTINYQNSMSTNVSSLVNYLKQFEMLPYFTKIDSLSISSDQADWRVSGAVSYSASLATEATQ